jgi:mannosyltransferase
MSVDEQVVAARVTSESGQDRVQRRLRALMPFLLVALLAAATRFVLIDHQSLWFDEIVTATLVKQPFGAMLHDIARTESTPPVYYVLEWVWTRIFGTTDLALRSLSACAGTLAVVVIYATARRVFSWPAAVVAAALAATHPMLIWYSQEARAYSLLTLFVSLSLYFFVRARSDPSTGNFVGWALTGSLAIGTHYFAAFVVFPEAVLLLYACRRRLLRPAVATALPLATAAALLPLAIHQSNTGHTSFIARIALKSRVQQVFNQLALGAYTISGYTLAILILIVAVAAAISIRRRLAADEQHAVLLLLLLGLAALVLPLVFSRRFFFYRNLIVALPPFLLVAGAACAPRRGGKAWVVVGVLAAAALLVPTAVIAGRESLQREDWNDVASLIDKAPGPRAILTHPRFEYVALSRYRHGLGVVSAGKVRVRELVLVGRPKLAIHDLPRGFHRVQDTRVGNLRLVRMTSSVPREIDVAALHLRPTFRLLHQNARPERDVGQDATLLLER